MVDGLGAEDVDEAGVAAVARLPPSLPILFGRSGSDARSCLDDLWDRGIGPRSVLVVDARAPGFCLDEVVTTQLRCRAEGTLPSVVPTSGWSVELDSVPDGPGARTQAALLALSSGVVGVRGDLEDQLAGSTRLVLVAGAYGTGRDGLVRPLPGPVFTELGSVATGENCRRVLDLRTGMLEGRTYPEGLRTVRFVSVARPTVAALRAEDDRPVKHWSAPLGPPLDAALAAEHRYAAGHDRGPSAWAETVGDRTVVRATASQQTWSVGARSRVERLVSYQTDRERRSMPDGAAIEEIQATGFDQLLHEHRQEWARRWSNADIEIGGDPDAQLAIRHALFQLLSCAPTEGEAAVGARGLTGLAYAGHVFWDTDVFVLPVLAATSPDAARAVLQYRINRLPAARHRATALGLPGARFPWESADSGEEATPASTRDVEGRVVPIRTGEYAEHINADVAWAALHYVDWTADLEFLDGPGRPLVLDTACYWQERVRLDAAGRGHIDGVIGPDEYHEVVDDNAFTNGMVRWHLRRAAVLAREAGDTEQARRFDVASGALVTGHDPVSGRHEQFAGFWALDQLLIGDIAEPPVAADVLLGRATVERSQVIKQPDVLMLHHLLPDELPSGSLNADLGYYLPRTAHGSSLSPAIAASLLARAGRPDEAMRLFDMAARLDLDDLTGTTAAGLHLATMGGLWQAIVYGFAGIRPTSDGLRIDPMLPRRWDSLTVRVLFRGVPLRITIDHEVVSVDSDASVPLIIDRRPMLSPVRRSHPVEGRAST